MDLITAEHLALEGARAASRSRGRRAAVVAPSLPFGGPPRGMTDWPGTLTLHPESFIQVYGDVARGLVRSGFTVVAAVNGCCGNVEALREACDRLRALERAAEFPAIGGIWEDRETIARVRDSGPGGTGHACEVETSLGLVLCPDRVHMERAVDEIPAGPVSFDFNDPAADAFDRSFGEITRSGVLGRATLATRAKGEEILRSAVARVAQEILILAR
jgi:creatinine amidohydrolase